MFHTAVCDLLNIRYPLLQGAMQGGGGVELVAAVSNAGALGVLRTSLLSMASPYVRPVGPIPAKKRSEC